MTTRDSRRITDLGTLKAFGHPLRMRLYRALCVADADAATASQLAAQVDEAVSLVSYHLRKLAEHGLIEEAEARSEDSRERWWKVVSRRITFRDRDFLGEPERVAAHAALSRTMLRQHVGMYEQYLDEHSAWEGWWESAFSSEYLPKLTPGELAELAAEMRAVMEKWEERGRAAVAEGDTEGRESVALHLYGFPFRSSGG
ncbi:ArsR/SmtB family transcription factor [Streptomyces sp. SBT349]|uniref:ArsR/SmtB family transcription factor n=1 Tax=Streptomyces sp. SBT349 TaxID=1580539 RepID=UPI00066C7FAF|nr:transcriptional regulator [Streptomyces sp. SBT349]